MKKTKRIVPSAAKQLDYHSWLCRAWEFIDKCRLLPDEIYIEQIVKPPATKRQLRRCVAELSRPLPRSLTRWFCEGSANCRLSYHWSPQSRGPSPLQRTIYRFAVGGEISFGPLEELSLKLDMCESWSEPLAKMKDQRSKRAFDLWNRSFPFCTFRDGDMLAVLPSDQGNEPVVYLIHDEPGDSFILAEDFDDFLRRWEQFRYCDQNGLCGFSKGGKLPLDPTSKAAEQLRAWLPAI